MTELPIDSSPSLWRRVTAAYAKLLEILLARRDGSGDGDDN